MIKDFVNEHLLNLVFFANTYYNQLQNLWMNQEDIFLDNQLTTDLHKNIDQTATHACILAVPARMIDNNYSYYDTFFLFFLFDNWVC